MVLWHEGHAKKCVERYCELADKTTQQLYKVSTPCIDDHHFKEEMKSVGELLQVCSQIVLKCFFLARIGRPDILWSVNKLARSITKWTKACHKRLNRLISYIHHTCEYKQYCYVGNTVKQCRLALFQDSDFAGDLEDSNSTSGGTLCVFGSHTFVRISWKCKKQTSQQNPKSSLWTLVEIGRDSRSRFVGSDCFCRSKYNSDSWSIEATRCERWQRSRTKQTISSNDQRVEFFWLCSLKRSFLLIKKLCCMCLRKTKQCLRWLSKEGVRQWDMFPGPTESRLIGCSIESTWTQKSKSSTSTPKTNLPTF